MQKTVGRKCTSVMGKKEQPTVIQGWIFRNILILLDRYALFMHSQVCLLTSAIHCVPLLFSTKDTNCARNVFLFGPLFISGKALQSLFTYEDSRENYFLMLFWFRSHGRTDLDSGPLADAMLQSTRSQEQKLPIERPLLLKIACISLKQVHIKRILLVSPIQRAQIDA